MPKPCIHLYAGRLLAATLISVSGVLFPLVSAQESAVSELHPGEQVYQTYCAGCHAGGDSRAASLRTLQSMSAEALEYTLTEGLMSAQA